ncbi:MAG: 4-hydroxybenzoate octaprenyltransferase [Gammaproteobacteria bacterium]|nr:4-hydroxybenzoate octaprenyltransferase [Gammaproteobacteria bacterium]
MSRFLEQAKKQLGAIFKQRKAYLRLMRLHQPVGIWLLLWPTLWALLIAGEGRPDEYVLVVFIIGTVILRSAGCIINDYADRNIDSHVERTKDRPLAAGQINVRDAIKLFIMLMLVGFALVLTMNRLTQGFAVAGALITILYPFSKRFISFPQLVLGVAFAWGVPMAFAAQLEFVPRVGWLLFINTIIWGVIYDTEYAMADRNEDLKIGVKSSAIFFGNLDRIFIGVLQLMFLVGMILVGQSANLGGWFLSGIGITAILFIYQQYLIRNRDSLRCFNAFKNNATLGLFVLTGIVLDYLFVS